MRDEVRKKILPPEDNYDEIDLLATDITDDEIEEIAEVIVEKRSDVKSILLGNNELGDKGAIILGEALKNLSNLSLLEVQNNEIDTQGMIALYKLQLTLSGLKLVLGGNKMRNPTIGEKIKEEVFRTFKP